MLICKNFIVLNFPKTGSTFIRKVVKDIYHQRIRRNPILRIARKLGVVDFGYKELLMEQPGIPGYKDQHGRYYMIPKKYLNRKIVSVVRNPFDRFLSLYQYRQWEKTPGLEKSILSEQFPHFPDLSFDDFVELKDMIVKKEMKKNNIELDIGIQSWQFIDMFFKNSPSVLENLSATYLNSNSLYKRDFPEISFLKQENLNEDLANFLMEYGFSKAEIKSVLNYDRVNKTSYSKKDITSIWTPKAINYVKEKEIFLFKVLHGLGIEYEEPRL